MLFFIFAVIFSIAVWLYAERPWLGKTMTAHQVKQRWGSSAFDEVKFKTADPQQRARMAYSLMTSSRLRGLDSIEIRERLGDFGGYFLSESYPTYLIQIAEEKSEESWQIVFLINRARKTKEVIVHKNCCG